MIKNTNSGETDRFIVAAPEFSLLRCHFGELEKLTADAFRFADKSGRRLLFEMRKLLHEILPHGITDNADFAEYTYALERLGAYLFEMDLPDNTEILFPGLQTALPEDEELLRRISAAGDHLTVSLTENQAPTLMLLQLMADGIAPIPKRINILTDRRVPADAVSSICRLWNMGADLTLCSAYSACRTAEIAGMHPKGKIDVFRGIITVPGKTVIRYFPLDAGTVSRTSGKNTRYQFIKSIVEEILKKQLSEQYFYSAKGEYARRQTKAAEPSDPLSIFCPGCISPNNRKIKGMLSGGTEQDIIGIGFESDCTDDIAEVASDIRCLAAACKFFDELYPVKAVPVFRDIRSVSYIDDVISAIKEHTSLSGYTYGGSVLELSIPKESELPSKDILSSVLNAFFCHGGIMIKINKGENND